MNIKIREVSSRTRDWEANGKKNRSYYVKIDGDERVFEVARNLDKPAPAVGESFDADIEEREHQGTTYYKLKRVYQQQRGNGAGGRSRDPQEQKRIAVQASQKVAVEVVRLGLSSLTNGTAPATVDTISEAVERVAERLFHQVEGLSAA